MPAARQLFAAIAAPAGTESAQRADFLWNHLREPGIRLELSGNLADLSVSLAERLQMLAASVRWSWIQTDTGNFLLRRTDAGWSALPLQPERQLVRQALQNARRGNWPAPAGWTRTAVSRLEAYRRQHRLSPESLIEQYFELLAGNDNPLAIPLAGYPLTAAENTATLSWLALTPQLAGDWLQHYLSGSEERKRSERQLSGSFFTPPSLIRPVLEAALAAFPDGKRILDPAVGAGAFLIEAVRQRPQAQLQCLGVDINPLALAITRRRLALFRQTTQANFHFELYRQDYLDTNFRQLDWIVGNPPFVQIRDIPTERRRELAGRFRLATGRFNLFSLFLEQAAAQLADSGVAAFVIPDRLLLNTQYQTLREHLLRRWQLTRLQRLPPRSFRQAAVDSVVLAYRPRPCPGSRTVEVGNRQFLPLDELYHRQTGQFVLSADSAVSRLLAKIVARSTPLGQLADSRDGIIQSKVGDKLFGRQLPDGAKPLLFGRQISAYQIHYEGDQIDYQPETMRQLEQQRGGNGLRLRQPAVFERPKLLTRQTADRIIAAYDAEGRYYYSNTLHGSAPVAADPWYLLAALNSMVVNFYYRATSDERGRNFAQIKLTLLRRLPIPELSSELQQTVGRLARAQTGHYSAERQLQIDQLFCRSLKLTTSEITLMRRFL